MNRQQLGIALLLCALREADRLFEKPYRSVKLLREKSLIVVAHRIKRTVSPAVPAFSRDILRLSPNTVAVFADVSPSVAVIIFENLIEYRVEFLFGHIGVPIHLVDKLCHGMLHTDSVRFRFEEKPANAAFLEEHDIVVHNVKHRVCLNMGIKRIIPYNDVVG